MTYQSSDLTARLTKRTKLIKTFANPSLSFSVGDSCFPLNETRGLSRGTVIRAIKNGINFFHHAAGRAVVAVVNRDAMLLFFARPLSRFPVSFSTVMPVGIIVASPPRHRVYRHRNLPLGISLHNSRAANIIIAKAEKRQNFNEIRVT